MKADIVKLSETDFALEGCLGFNTADILNKKATQLFMSKGYKEKEINFNCENVQHCDSAGIALIIKWKKLFLRKGIKMRFSHITTQMQNLLNLMDLTNLLSD